MKGSLELCFIKLVDQPIIAVRQAGTNVQLISKKMRFTFYYFLCLSSQRQHFFNHAASSVMLPEHWTRIVTHFRLLAL